MARSADALIHDTASVLGGTSLYGGVGNVFPGAFIGTIFFLLAVFIDSLRNDRKVKLEQRSIRVEGASTPGRKPSAGARAGTS